MFSKRKFQFNGEEMTRGEYGVRITGGHNTIEHPNHILVFDPDFGDQVYGSIATCLKSGEWEEIDISNRLSNMKCEECGRLLDLNDVVVKDDGKHELLPKCKWCRELAGREFNLH